MSPHETRREDVTMTNYRLITRIGFTGTRQGMTNPQRAMFRELLAMFSPREFHHGDCVGADAEAHDMVANYTRGCLIVVHPPVDDEHRAGRLGDEMRTPLTHFARNRAIVDATDLLVGISVADRPLDRGGTWYTIRYAEKRGKPVRVVWPDGTVSESPPRPPDSP